MWWTEEWYLTCWFLRLWFLMHLNKKLWNRGEKMPVSPFVRAKEGLAGWLTWQQLKISDTSWAYLRLCMVVVSFVFLFKTSRVRTPETPEDYCKLCSGDVFGREGGGRRAGMRALHSPAPKTRKSIIWGVQIIWRYNASHHQRQLLNVLKRLITPFLRCIIVLWLHISSAFNCRLSGLVCSLKSLWMAPSKSPQRPDPVCVLTLMPLTMAWSYLTTVFTCKIR